MTSTFLARGISAAIGIALAGSALAGVQAGNGITIPSPNPMPPYTVPPTIQLPVTSPTASSKINAAEAWALCRVAAVSLFPAGSWKPSDYSGSSNAPVGSAGSWQVRVGFAPLSGGYGAVVDCTVTGTLGAPLVTTKGPVDLG